MNGTTVAVNVDWRSIRPLNGGRDKRFEEFCGHCQLVEGSALLPRDIDATDRSQQAHVTASHSTNARVRSRR